MQTLDEALRPYAIVNPTPEELANWKDRGLDVCSKNLSLIAEVASNPVARQLVWYYMETSIDCGDDGNKSTMYAFLLTIFAHGVAVGVAMGAAGI